MLEKEKASHEVEQYNNRGYSTQKKQQKIHSTGIIQFEMKKNQPSATTLRQQAEDLLKNKSPEPVAPISEADTLKLIHELQVHQIELEMQHEELMLAKEQIVKAANNKYVELYDFAPSGYFTLSREGKIIGLNLTGASMLGKERSILKNSSLGFFITEDTKPVFKLFLEKVFTHKAIETSEVVLATESNLPTYVHLSGKLADNGKHCLLTVVDITKIKLEEEALRQSNSKWEAMVTASPDGIGMVSLDGKLQHMSDKLAEMYGFSIQEKDGYIGNSFFDFIDPSNHELLIDINRKLIAGEDIQSTREYIALKKDKSRFQVEINSSVLRDSEGKPVNILYVQRDITERKATESALKKLSQAIEQSPVMTYITNRDGNIEYANPKVLAVTGYSNEELTGKNPRIFSSGEKPKEEYKLLWETISAGKEWKGEFHNKKKNGEFYCVAASITPVVDAGGEINHFLAIEEDITGRKLTEQKIHDLNENLEKRIIERTSQLAETNKNLEKEIENRRLVEVELELEKQRLADIIEGTDAGTWEWNIQTGETFFNERWANILGYTLDEIAPVSIQTWMGFTHPDDLKVSDELLEKHFKGELDYYSFESRTKHKNGGWVWGLTRGKIHTWDKDGKPLLMSGTLQDITDRKRAENDLVKLTTRLTLAVRAGGIGVWDFDIQPNILVWDDRMFALYGIDKKDFAGAYEAWQAGLHPDDKAQGDAEIQMAISGEKDFDTEFRVVWPDGTVRNIRAIGIVQRDAAGKPLHMIGTNLDITDQKQAVALIKQTQQNYETFFNTIDDFLFVLDEQGNIIHTNTTVTKRLGYTTDDLYEKSVLMVHPAERRDEAGRIVGEMLAGTSEFCPVPLITKSGYQIPVETRVTQGFWDNKKAIFGVSKDVSKIQLSEEKFSKVFYLNPSACGLSDLATGKYVELNDAFYTLLGFTENEVIGKTPTELGILNEETITAIVKSADSNGSIYNAETTLRAKNGEIKYVMLSAENIHLQDATYRFTVVHDISELKKAEEENKKAKKLAENANIAKSEFLARMSHELRTPMNSILGFAQLLEMGEISPVHRKGVNHIIVSGNHLLNLINEVLDISRIEAGRIILSPEPVQLTNLLLEMLDVVQPLAAKRNLKTALEYSPSNRLFVLADKRRLKQVLLNLINNAVKYNREGGSILIKTELRQTEKLEPPMIRISISDTGLGINQEDIHKLFVPFERIGADTTETEGTGLGLAVVNKLMAAMGGEVGVYSIPAQGSTFWIELPQTTLQQEQNNAVKDLLTIENRANATTGTILYVEDNIQNAELLKEIINSYRPAINLIIARYGKQAVEIATQSKADLILLDLDLPDLHGSQVLELLKAEEKTKAIPVVVISADAMQETIEKLMQAGTKNYLTKPLDIIAFLKVVDAWMGKRN